MSYKYVVSTYLRHDNTHVVLVTSDYAYFL